MLCLRTWSDDSGYAFPSLRTWAKGARMAIGTLRKHIDTAVRLEWLGVEVWQQKGKNWRQNVYRCSVPAHVELNAKDQALADLLVAEYGEIGEGVSTMDDTAKAENAPAVSPRVIQQHPETLRESDAVSKGTDVLCQTTPLAVSKNLPAVSNGALAVSTRVTPKLLSQALEAHNPPHTQGAAARPRGGDLKTGQRAEPDPETEKRAIEADKAAAAERERKRAEERRATIRRAIEGFPNDGDEAIAKILRGRRVSPDEVAEARRQQA
jgi:hypothetical protein